MGINRKIILCSSKKWNGKSSLKNHLRSNKKILEMDSFGSSQVEKEGTSGDLSPIRKRKLFFFQSWELLMNQMTILVIVRLNVKFHKRFRS